MRGTLVYKQELIEVLGKMPQEMAKEVVDFAKYLQWQSIPKKTFSERVDNLWDKMREQAEKSNYSPKDVGKLIAAVRKKK